VEGNDELVTGADVAGSVVSVLAGNEVKLRLHSKE
jgi:hypothetical protein